MTTKKTAEEWTVAIHELLLVLSPFFNPMNPNQTPTPETEFQWTRIGSPSKLKSFYESKLPAIRKAAKQCGYAIAVHGSLCRDFDLIAAPWSEQHSDEQTLCKAIHKAACGLTQESYQICTDKPCGRLTTMFPVCWIEYLDAPKNGTGHIDLSIMPDVGPLERRLSAETSRAEKWKRVAGLLNVASLCDCTQDGGIGCDACQTALASYAEAMKE